MFPGLRIQWSHNKRDWRDFERGTKFDERVPVYFATM
jgi:hypothetical protein